MPGSLARKVLERYSFCLLPEKCKVEENMLSAFDSVSWKIMSSGEQILDKGFNFLVVSMSISLCTVK